MKWFNLKNNKCPQCSKDWVFQSPDARGRIRCDCGFSIHKNRAQEIISSMVSKQIDSEHDNLEALNNL